MDISLGSSIHVYVLKISLTRKRLESKIQINDVTFEMHVVSIVQCNLVDQNVFDFYLPKS